MNIFKSPLSPQQNVSQPFEGCFRSEKIQKSRGSSLFEAPEQSITLIKENRNPSMINNETSIFNRNSLNNTRLIGLEVSNRPYSDDVVIPIQLRQCFYCKLSSNLMQICKCSMAHQECANAALDRTQLELKLTCPNCKEYRHIMGVVSFDASKWRGNIIAIIIELIAMMILIGLVASMTYVASVQLNGELEKDRFLIACLVFSYTIGFILFVCLLTKLVGHFKKIDYRIRKYDLKNAEFNRQYVEMLINEC